MNRQSDQPEALAAVVLEVGRDAARRVCGLAASGIELSLLPVSPPPAREGALDADARSERSCGMRRFAALTVAVLAGFAGLLLQGSAPARAAAGGCSVASAPTIQPGQTQTGREKACPNGLQYWAMNLKLADTLNVDVTPGVTVEPYQLSIYGPNVGTIGSPLCVKDGAGPSRVSCLIPAAGRWMLVTSGAGSFTPSVKSVPAQTGRVAGACDPANAPAAPDRVTQYVSGNVCRPSGTAEYWRIDLLRGDVLNVNVRPIVSSGTAEPFAVRVYGPNPGSLGKPLCANVGVGTTTVTCRIRRSGGYVIEGDYSGSFTPQIVRPTTTRVTGPRFVKGGGAIVIRTVVRSNTPNPVGTCVVQQRSGSSWAAVARVRTRGGVCSARVPETRRGTVTLRVHFKGAKGWASSTSRPISVVVG